MTDSALPPIPHKPYLKWSTKKTETWKDYAVNAQNEFNKQNNGIDWNQYKCESYDALDTTILISVYGNNYKQNASLTTTLLYLYNSTHRQVAKSIRKKIYKKSDKTENIIWMNVVRVIIKMGNNEDHVQALPVFRIKTQSGDAGYVDQYSRYYENWESYLNANLLPQCMMCYPRQGCYESSDKQDNIRETVECEFAESPACTLWERTKATGKKVMTVAAIVLPVVGIIAPPLAALAAGSQLANAAKIATVIGRMSSGVAATQRVLSYANFALAITNFGYTMYDRITQEDQILWTDFIGLAVALVNFGTSIANERIVSSAVKEGVKLTAFQSTLITFLNSASFGISSVSVLSAIGVMLFKEKKDPSDYINFALSLYYFTGALMRPKTAKGIYKEFENKYIVELQEQNKKLQHDRQQLKEENKKLNGEKAANSEKPQENSEPRNENTQSGETTTSNREKIKELQSENAKIAKENVEFRNKNETAKFSKELKEKSTGLRHDQDGNRIDEHGNIVERNPNEDPKQPQTEDEVRKKLDELQEKITNPDAKDYFKNHIRSQIQTGTTNELRQSNQLIRLMLQVNDINDFFCEVASTETKFTFADNGELIINNEIQIHAFPLNDLANSNPDGATQKKSFADERCTLIHKLRRGELTESGFREKIKELVQSERELLFEVTHDHQNDTVREKKISYENFNKKHKFMFEVHCEEVRQKLNKVFPGNTDSMFTNLTPSDLSRVATVMGEMKSTKLVSLWTVAKVLADKNGCQNIRQMCSYVELVKQLKSEPTVTSLIKEVKAESGNPSLSDYEMLKHPKVAEKLDELFKMYYNDMRTILRSDPNGYGWSDPVSALYHPLKHPPSSTADAGGTRRVSFEQMKEYYSTGQPFEGNAKEGRYTQDGSLIKRSYLNDFNNYSSSNVNMNTGEKIGREFKQSHYPKK